MTQSICVLDRDLAFSEMRIEAICKVLMLEKTGQKALWKLGQ